MEQNPMPWFEIYVEDMKRARKFYEGLLGVTLTFEICPEVRWSCQRQPVH